MNLSENLKEIRKRNSLSQEQLAEKLGVSRQAVSKWESGQSYPEMDKMLLICKLFNFNIDELMNKNIIDVDENNQVKANRRFVNKVINMFCTMSCLDMLKCLLENVFMIILAFGIYVLLSSIGGHIFANSFGFVTSSIFSITKHIIEIFFTILFLTIVITILLYRFKIRYLDYYGSVNVSKEEKEKI